MNRIVCLLFSVLGYYLALHQFLNGKKAALYPALFVSFVTVTGFFACLLNNLQYVFSFIYIAGFLLLGIYWWKTFFRRQEITTVTLQSVLPFAIVCAGSVWLYIILKDYFLYSYDDFTHWGKIIRVIATEWRFPLASDQFTHASYPPGSALFVAYIANICGNNDGVWLFAQSFMLLSMWVSILSACKKTVGQLFLALFLYLFLNYNTPLRALHVDNLLAASVFAGIVLCFDKKEKSHFAMLALVLTTTALIKSSGMFLVLFTVLWAISLDWKNTHKVTVSWLLLLLPLIVLYMWNQYIDLHITEGLKHQISYSNYKEILGEKSFEDILTILKMMVPIMVDPGRNHALYLIPVYVCMFLINYYVIKERTQNSLLLFSVSVFALYEIGMLMMYIFSMPMGELLAQNGNDYTRYNGTIVAVLLAILLYQTGTLIPLMFSKEKKRNIVWCSISVLFAAGTVYYVLSLQISPLRNMEYQIEKYQTAHQFSMMKTKLDKLPEHSSYIVLFENEELWSGYDRGISQYYLKSKDIIRCYDRQQVLEAMTKEPWRYYIDLAYGSVHLPDETVGVELYPSILLENSETNLLSRIGYCENTRYSVTAIEDIASYGWDTTGYCSVRPGEVIRLANITWYLSSENEGRGGLTLFSNNKDYLLDIRTKTAEDLATWKPAYDEAGNIIEITVPSDINAKEVYLRITCQDIDSASSITIIENSES